MCAKDRVIEVIRRAKGIWGSLSEFGFELVEKRLVILRITTIFSHQHSFGKKENLDSQIIELIHKSLN